MQKNQKLTKIVEKSVRRRFANEPSEKNSIFSLADATRRRFWSPRPSPERSRAPLWASRAALGDSPGAPGARRGRSRDAPRRLRDVPERHWASRVGPGTDFRSILGAPGPLPGPILDRFSCRFSCRFSRRVLLSDGPRDMRCEAKSWTRHADGHPLRSKKLDDATTRLTGRSCKRVGQRVPHTYRT